MHAASLLPHPPVTIEKSPSVLPMAAARACELAVATLLAMALISVIRLVAPMMALTVLSSPRVLILANLMAAASASSFIFTSFTSHAEMLLLRKETA